MRHHLGKKAASLGSAVGMVVASMALHANAANLLTNPGFESPSDTTGASTDTTVSAWTLYGGDAVRANFQNHTTGGEWSIWEQTFQPADGGVYQNVGGITDGTAYTLTGYYYFEMPFRPFPMKFRTWLCHS